MYDCGNIFTTKMIDSFKKDIISCIESYYKCDLSDIDLQFSYTKQEFEGDVTLVIFPLLKISKKSLKETGEDLSHKISSEIDTIKSCNLVHGFLNFVLDQKFWLQNLDKIICTDNYGFLKRKEPNLYLVEFSSPNTNKPLHLGHIRNNILGDSISRIIEANGHEVRKVQIINDRGIHICKSMVAWEKFGNKEIPSDKNMKGDHFVGHFYIMFEKQYKKEQEDLINSGCSEKESKLKAPIMLEAKDMLLKWEQNDKHTVDLWKKMNKWVYEGFEETYKKLNICFDKNYYESETYKYGKKIVLDGLNSGIFKKEEDNSISVSLEDVGLDKKILLRSDGTSLYITQDLGTAVLRNQDYNFFGMIYVVGNEQDYHFKVLFHILNKLNYKWSDQCHHLSYGMVDLPSGKMKSREGKVVDADDLLDDIVCRARSTALELGKLDDMSDDTKNDLYSLIGKGALRYHLLKIDPKKNIMFSPEDSIDFNGNTGPFIQYTFARIRSLVLKSGISNFKFKTDLNITEQEVRLIKIILKYPEVIQDSFKLLSPSLIANFVYDLVKEYNNYYQNNQILSLDDEHQVCFKVALSDMVSRVIESGMNLLGIFVPQKM